MKSRRKYFNHFFKVKEFFVYCALGIYSTQGWFMGPRADMDY